ncbi:hypothetical protein L227DRAFT_502814 [Lentinus tigrinus ALCF2SS1-6]|uniref:Protein kinase domain-containing protein n=1 Tax=Lentinus tigrinus ALCF2SS1-6 TaxID=1328759 RepID=A0A5C2S7T2_9APHY|nr:hypothetical protein L227DRAFT_502814 [Lentinus tigrinus ALCF2SS1-6]
MRPFWSAYRGWLSARGFHLQALREHEAIASGEIWCPPPFTSTAPLPYAQRRIGDETGSAPPSPYLKCAPAQDSHGRDVTIKLVNTFTHEYHIYQDLLRCDALFGQDFQGVLPPVAILDTPYRFSFVVMPTWGKYNRLSDLETVGQVVDFMHCMLKGLSFLHSRRVAHRDIDDHNTMNNLYSLWDFSSATRSRLIEHRRTSCVLYCLFDFNMSVQFPLETPLHECRLVAETVMFAGTQYNPCDVHFGAYDYDPFAHDVACLGNMFRAQFATIVGSVPEFALLFDRMTTHIISGRLTASNALTYFEEVVKGLPDYVLENEVVLDCNLDFQDMDTYWSLLPPELSSAWAKYRTPPVFLRHKILNYISSHSLGYTVLSCVRRKLRI